MAYKLTYFDGRGVAETIRFLFSYGGIDFEDNRIKQEDWPQHKDKTPWGQVPILEHDGKTINQSVAIARYVGKLVKLGGNNEWEDLEIDAAVDTFGDLRTKIMTIFFNPDEEKKKILKEGAINETIPYYLTRFDAQIAKNDGYLVLGRLTWADVVVTAALPSINMFTGEDTIQKYPNVKGLQDKVTAIPNIKKWIENRPNTSW